MAQSDQLKEFNFDKARDDAQRSYENVTEIKVQVMKQEIGFFEGLADCDKLKEKLIALLEKLELELKVIKKYIEFQTNNFKNKIMNTIIVKKLKAAALYIMSILCTVQVALLAMVATLGLQMAGLICIESIAAFIAQRAAACVCIGAVALGGIFMTFKSVWESRKSKKNLLEAIQMTEKALAQVQSQKNNL